MKRTNVSTEERNGLPIQVTRHEKAKQEEDKGTTSHAHLDLQPLEHPQVVLFFPFFSCILLKPKGYHPSYAWTKERACKRIHTRTHAQARRMDTGRRFVVRVKVGGRKPIVPRREMERLTAVVIFSVRSPLLL